MSGLRRRGRLALLGPCAFACAADVTMTLAGQPAAYWAGDAAAARDYNPLVRALLEAHPAAFPTSAVVGLVLLAVLLRYVLNPRLGYVLAFAMTFVQVVAAGGWLIGFGPAGWVGAVALLVIAERWIAHLRPDGSPAFDAHARCGGLTRPQSGAPES